MSALRSIWNQMPALRLLIAVVVGIGVYFFTIAYVDGGVLSTILLLSSLVFLVYINSQSNTAKIYVLRYWTGTAVIAALICIGYIVAYYAADERRAMHIANANPYYISDSSFYIASVADPIVVKDKTVSVLLDWRLANKGDSTLPIAGRAVASIYKDPRSQALQYGDEIILRGTIKEYDPPKNPFQFDYKRYQSLHHIQHRVYVKANDWRITKTGQGNLLLANVYRVRAYFLSLLLQYVPAANERAVATAILLGYRDYMTDDVLLAYSGSGVLHVLSVSGLHVAILFAVLNFLLGWLDRKRRGQILKGVLIIIAMLFYAILTGMSPPVLRSVFMFILICIAKILDREVSIANVVAVSCVLLLLYDPYFIADVGFQLSYIAVFGILYLYPKIYALVPFSYSVEAARFKRIGRFISKWGWGLIAVSIAAQLATFPISLYYFHSFPNLFLLSNIVVIPASNLILITGMLLFSTGWWTGAAMVVGSCLNHFLVWLNAIVFWIEGLPMAMTKGIIVSNIEMALLFIFIACCCIYTHNRRAKVLLTTLGCLLLLCSSFAIHSICRSTTAEWVVYSIDHQRAIAYIEQQRAYSSFDSSIRTDTKLFRFYIQNHWWQRGVQQQTTLDSLPYTHYLPFGTLYQTHSKRVLLIDKPIQVASPLPHRLDVDIAILTTPNGNTISSIHTIIAAQEYVFDCSNKPYQIKKWIQECDSLHLQYWDCRQGAYSCAVR